jgi:hypothetical protein
VNDNIQSTPESKPNPDPTVATNDAVARAVRAERDYVIGQVEIIITRINAIDEATKVLSQNVNRTPTLLQTSIKSFSALMNEKFRGVDRRLAAAEKLRLEQKQDSKTGLDAALAAQKEAAGTQDINNQKAIDKSEKATAEIIKNNQDTNKQVTDTLTKNQDELKTAVTNILATKAGSTETTDNSRAENAERRANIAIMVSVVLVILTVIGITVTIIIATRSHP